MTDDKKPQTCDDHLRDFTKRMTDLQQSSEKDETAGPQRTPNKKRRNNSQKNRRTKRSAKTFADLMGPPLSSLTKIQPSILPSMKCCV